MENFTRDRILMVLANEYRYAKIVYDSRQREARREAEEHGCTNGYLALSDRALSMRNFCDGIKAAAKALGISEDELEAAATVHRASGREGGAI